MAEITTTVAVPTPPRPRRFHFEWIFPVLFRPRAAFTEIAAQTRGVWLTPLLLLTLTGLIYTLMAGYVGPAAPVGAASGEGMGEAFEWYTPEQQAQLEQQMQAMNSPVFRYVLPAFRTVLAVWLGWLVVGGVLHLMLTLFGGRSTTGSTMNVVAWASLPLALGWFIQTMYLLIERRPIAGQGLAGFAPQGEGFFPAFLAALLGLISAYLIWQIVLLVIGVQRSSHVTLGRAIVSVLITFGLILLLQSLAAYGGSLLSNLQVSRGFFF